MSNVNYEDENKKINSYISFLMEKNSFFHKIANDKDFLYSEINKLKDSPQLDGLIDFYKNASGPTTILRLFILKNLKAQRNITENFVNETKQKFNNKDIEFFKPFLDDAIIENIQNYKSPKGGDPFHSWKDPFRVFYVYFFLGDIKQKIKIYLNEIGQAMLERLNLADYTMRIVDFDGCQNQGNDICWISLFPARLKNYNNAIQIFLELNDKDILAGIYKGSKVTKNITLDDKERRDIYGSFENAIEGLLSLKDQAIKLNNSINDENSEETQYWMYAAGRDSQYWDEFSEKGIMAIGWDELGNLSKYTTKNEMKKKLQEFFPNSSNMNHALATWEFANCIKPGDIIYVKQGRNLIKGRGVVTSDYIYDESRSNYKNIRQVNWTNKGEWNGTYTNNVKTLTNITEFTEDINNLENLFNLSIDDSNNTNNEPYTEEDFLNEVFMDDTQYEILKKLLINKQNIILQGAPGVGKTYVAKRLAYSILGEVDPDKVKMIQFHQSYGYEDFIMGYRPNGSGFELSYGPFYNFCKKAKDDSENKYFFIIDEINRGKLSKIFGELLMLIEKDKRGSSLRLLYKDEQFSVPSNVYIIGMMNTADRSLAMIDYALRRRFAFYSFLPAFKTEKFKEYVENKANIKFQKIIEKIIELNNEILKDESLGEGFQIGHSYFCTDEEVVQDEWLESVIEYEIAPLLNEYWFDEKQKAENWINELRNIIK